MKILPILVILLMADFMAPAQSVSRDSVDNWQTKVRDCGRSIDSFRIMAIGLQEDRQVLEQRLLTLQDSVNHVAGRDFAKNIHYDPSLDSLLQKLVNLKLTAKYLSERFEFRLVQIDGLLWLKSNLESKIYHAGK